METTKQGSDGIDDGGCAGCRAAIVRVQFERRELRCERCGERYLPTSDDPHRRRSGNPARDLRLLARWLPAMDARSPALARVGWSGHNGAGGSARGGRLEHVDERSVEFGRAVEVWRHLRVMIARGDGEAVAVLWTAWALAPVVDDPRRDHRARVEAVALGAAPRVLRQEWRVRAAETAAASGVAALATRGAVVRVLAQAWGAEALRMLWAPARVPRTVVERAALGWAGDDVRAAWEATQGSVRDRAVEDWAEGAMRAAVGRY